MDKEKIRYILDYHASLMTKEEASAWRHWHTSCKLGDGESKTRQYAKRKEIYLQKGWMTNDENVLKLLENGIEEFERKVAERIDALVVYNNCPKCGKLTRTPKAKQCRFCGYDWH